MKLTLEPIKVNSITSFVLRIDGKPLPAQVRTNVISEAGELTRVVVEFYTQPDVRDGVEIISPPIEPVATKEHTLITEGDEHVCTTCRKRWSFDDDDVPVCD